MTDLSNNGHVDELVGESATSVQTYPAKQIVCQTRVHAATVQTGHDTLERDFKAMKDKYDKICSENQQLNALFTKQQKDKEKIRARDEALK